MKDIKERLRKISSFSGRGTVDMSIASYNQERASLALATLEILNRLEVLEDKLKDNKKLK